MSVVWRARERSSGEICAVKVMKPEFARDPLSVERFHQEVLITKRFAHRNIVKVYRTCVDDGDVHGTHFFVMEYIDGTDLRELIRQARGRVSTERIVHIISQVCDALQYAHERAHVVHRDITPSNIIVTRTGRVVLTDFGIARPAGARRLTGLFTILGTGEYMSPEHVDPGKIEPRSDLYSLGVVMYEMATGRVPFEGNSPMEILAKHCTDQPPMPSSANPALAGGALEKIILKLLKKKPSERYQSAGELKQSLQSLIAARLTPARRSIPDGLAHGMMKRLRVHKPVPVDRDGPFPQRRRSPHVPEPSSRHQPPFPPVPPPRPAPHPQPATNVPFPAHLLLQGVGVVVVIAVVAGILLLGMPTWGKKGDPNEGRDGNVQVDSPTDVEALEQPDLPSNPTPTPPPSPRPTPPSPSPTRTGVLIVQAFPWAEFTIREEGSERMVTEGYTPVGPIRLPEGSYGVTFRYNPTGNVEDSGTRVHKERVTISPSEEKTVRVSF